MPKLVHRGCALAYEVAGTGPPILFVQGVGVHGDGWLPQVERLSAKYSCLRFDNRGMGRSQPLGDGQLTIDLMVDDALALVDTQTWARFHVVGHSMGGHIATALALRAPERVLSLALLCTSARGKDMPPLSTSFLWTSLRSRIGPRRNRRHAFLEIVLPRSVRGVEDLDTWAARLEPLFGHDLADTPRVVMRQIRAYRLYDGVGKLSALRGTPTLVMAAEEDSLAPPRLGRALAAEIPGARYVEFADASHGLTITHANELNEQLAEHLATAGNAGLSLG
jgi:aminoacrylate hydrolase